MCVLKEQKIKSLQQMRKLSVTDKQIYELHQQDAQKIIMKTSNNIHIYYNGQIQIYNIQDNVILSTIILPEIENYDAENPEQTSVMTQSMIDEPSYIAGVYEKTIIYYKRLVLNMYNTETNKIKQTRISEKNIIFAKHLITNILMVQVIQDIDVNKQQSSLRYYYIDEMGYLNVLPNITSLKYNNQIVDIQIIDTDIKQIYFIVFENGKIAILQPPIRMHEYIPDNQDEYITYLDLAQMENMKLLTAQYLYSQTYLSDEIQEENVQNDIYNKQKLFFVVYDKAVAILKTDNQSDQVSVQYIKKFDNIRLTQAAYNFNTNKLIIQTSNKDVRIYNCQNGIFKKLTQFKEKLPVKQFVQHSDNDIFAYITEHNTLVSFKITEKVTHIPTISVASVMLITILIMVLYKRSINLSQSHPLMQHKLETNTTKPISYNQNTSQTPIKQSSSQNDTVDVDIE